MSTDPHEPGGISVTIKGDEPGGKYNDAKTPGTWVVFHGSPAKVKEQICEFFGLEFSENYQRPLFDLVNEATNLFKAAANASRTLGASVLTKSDGTPAQSSSDVWQQAQQGETSPPWPTEEKKAEPKVDPVIAAIEGCSSVADLQQVWAENQDAFNANPSYMDTYKAKGRALTAV